VDGDDMLIEGGTICGNRVDSHDDHRIAMACGVLALRAKGVVEVARPECVAKSYPEFFEELTRLQERR
ncbi:MAG: 3-phosphoshikimate 1-carboxyvinyltransferase, partial [Deltaproteobacteria bacterium]|nr:3-phosphoshikimate 1-carboxyvinyltransferase [Deltaproteobacteria bacterium]